MEGRGNSRKRLIKKREMKYLLGKMVGNKVLPLILVIITAATAFNCGGMDQTGKAQAAIINPGLTT